MTTFAPGDPVERRRAGDVRLGDVLIHSTTGGRHGAPVLKVHGTEVTVRNDGSVWYAFRLAGGVRTSELRENHLVEAVPRLHHLRGITHTVIPPARRRERSS